MTFAVTTCKLFRPLCVLAMLAASAGCVAYPDGRPIGADALARVVGLGAPADGCNCHRAGSGHHDGPSHAYGGTHFGPEHAIPSWVADIDDSEGGEFSEGGEVADGDEFIGPPDAHAGSESYATIDGDPECGDVHHGSHAGTALRSVGELPRHCFAETANFYLPAAACGPPEIPPPGRFHPVPTQPVFTPRPVLYDTAAAGF